MIEIAISRGDGSWRVAVAEGGKEVAFSYLYDIDPHGKGGEPRGCAELIPKLVHLINFMLNRMGAK